jgi:hypothetical protein
MILKYNKFTGKVTNNFLKKEEVIDLVSLITDLKPTIPELLPDGDISKLIDNITYYESEDGQYKIMVYFRESDVYHNSDGTITYGKFKSLFKISITSNNNQLQIGDLKDYVILTSDIITEVYPESKLMVKLADTKYTLDEFSTLEDSMDIEKLILIIRII